MCGRLDFYLNAFSNLRTDKNNSNWTGLTYNRSPYGPLLLLSIFDLIEVQKINRNFIELSFELAQTYQEYCSVLPSPDRQVSMAIPFFLLKDSEFRLSSRLPG